MSMQDSRPRRACKWSKAKASSNTVLPLATAGRRLASFGKVGRATVQAPTIIGWAAVTALTNAYEGVCAALQLTDRTDPLAEVVAKRIIEHARRGERKPHPIA